VLTRTMVTARIERVLNDFIRGVTRIEPKTWVPYRGGAAQIGYVSCSQACGPNQGLVPTWLRPVSRPRRPRALPAKWVIRPSGKAIQSTERTADRGRTSEAVSSHGDDATVVSL
jgi:hypothetical protein